MKKLVVSGFLWALAQSCFAVNAYDIALSIRNSTNTGYINLIPASPTTTNGIFYFDNGMHTAYWLAPGNLTVSGGALYAPQADWNATTGGNVIANKPTIPTKTSDLTNDSNFLDSATGVTPSAMSAVLANYPNNAALASALSGKFDTPTGSATQEVLGDGSLATRKTLLSQFTNDSGFITSIPAQSFASLTSKPTTLAGYGITDADPLGAASAVQAYAIQRANQSGTQSADTVTDGVTNKAFLATERTKLAGIATGATNVTSVTQIVSGNSSQYLNGAGTPTAFPPIQTIQRLRVQTDASGNYTWTYPIAYAAGVVPIISALSESASSTVPQGVQIVGVPTNTTATFKVINLPSTSVLSIVVLGAPTAAQAFIHLTAVAP